jgi:hypothetical protein
VVPVCLAIAVLAWSICRRSSFEVGLAVCLIAGLLVSPHDYLHDWTITIPALLILYSQIPAAQAGALLLASPLFMWMVVWASVWLIVAWLGCLCIVTTAVCLLWTVRKSQSIRGGGLA